MLVHTVVFFARGGVVPWRYGPLEKLLHDKLIKSYPEVTFNGQSE